jgi:copper transport protein
VLQVVVLARQTHAAAAAADSSFAAALRDLTFGSRWGALWLAGIAALAATIAVARRLRALGTGLSAPATVAAALAPASLVAIDALGSHAASASHAAGPVAVEAIHLLSASLWVGGIAALTTALVPVRGLRPVETRAFASAVRRPFAALAGGSAAVAALTGLYSAGVQVTSVDALLTTGYGKTLLAKTGVVAIVCVLGAANFRALRRLGRHQRGHTLVAVEVAAGAGALLAAAVLTASAPARGPEFGPPRPVDAPTLAAQAEDVVLAVTLRPNRPGPNLVTVVAASSIRPAPAPIAAVRIGGSRLRHVGGDHWAGTVDLAAPGVASLPIRVGRGDTELPARVTWRVEAADPARPVRYSSRRISAFVNPLVVLLLALAAASAAAYTLRRRGPTLANPPREEHA